jgi:hypothetical protein
MQGVDPDSPDAFMRIFENIMALFPWWPLFWMTVVCVVVGALLGWWRRRVWLGIGMALVLGPVGWIALWMFPRGTRARAGAEADARTSDAK